MDRASRARAARVFVAFLSTALAIVLLVGESAYHRLRGEPYDKANLVRRATSQTIAALALNAVALAAVVFVVGSVVFDRGVAIASTLVVLVITLGIWFVLPLRRHWRATQRLSARPAAEAPDNSPVRTGRDPHRAW